MIKNLSKVSSPIQTNILTSHFWQLKKGGIFSVMYQNLVNSDLGGERGKVSCVYWMPCVLSIFINV